MAAPVALPSEHYRETALADWLELSALLADDGNASHGDLQRALNRMGSEQAEESCRNVMTELRHRVQDAGGRYPFRFSGSLLSIQEDWSAFTPYVFCLLLSFCDDKAKQIADIHHTRLFESLCCAAARDYIGGKVVRFGAPREELPAGFVDALEEIKKLVIEWPVPPCRASLNRQDDGLDLVAWKPFPDLRVGKLILFGHCASGHDWEDKILELIPDRFCSSWLGGEQSPVVKTFFIPHRVELEHWERLVTKARLFFDRCRIAATINPDDMDSRLRKSCLKWCKAVLRRLGRRR